MVNQIKAKCKEKGLSVLRLEKAAGIGMNTIYKWDNAPPGIDKVQRVASVLECTIDDLIREEASA